MESKRMKARTSETSQANPQEPANDYQGIHFERPEPLLIMDELESALLHHGWPIPCSPYYIVHHQKILEIVDRLRVSLREEMDERFLRSFGPAFDNPLLI